MTINGWFESQIVDLWLSLPQPSLLFRSRRRTTRASSAALRDVISKACLESWPFLNIPDLSRAGIPPFFGGRLSFLNGGKEDYLFWGYPNVRTCFQSGLVGCTISDTARYFSALLSTFFNRKKLQTIESRNQKINSLSANNPNSSPQT